MIWAAKTGQVHALSRGDGSNLISNDKRTRRAISYASRFGLPRPHPPLLGHLVSPLFLVRHLISSVLILIYPCLPFAPSSSPPVVCSTIPAVATVRRKPDGETLDQSHCLASQTIHSSAEVNRWLCVERRAKRALLEQRLRVRCVISTRPLERPARGP
ncbi:hypothetical protein PENSPDRAFT_329300 [Peniophora sp. CONT]|nr:hypothetical protein PENSPDRAFT_329300 [Peniophora sp. CONT]